MQEDVFRGLGDRLRAKSVPSSLVPPGTEFRIEKIRPNGLS